MGHQFKKQFGQNFLRNLKFAHALADAAEVKAGDVVVEIGPGDGSVTKVLLQRGARVIAIEIDYDLIVALIKRFNWSNDFELEHANIMDVDVQALLKQHSNLEGDDFAGKYKVMGSLPYNISKQIIFKFMTAAPRPATLAVIIQAEVAAEYAALPPQATFLSNWLRLHAEVRKLVTIPKSQFNPTPQVDGAILQAKLLPIAPADLPATAQIASLIKLGFTAPRKTLWNNLRHSNQFQEDKLRTAWEQLQLSPTARPAELELTTWQQLYAILNGNV